MKKIIMLLTLVLALSLTACTKNVSNTPDNENKDVVQNEVQEDISASTEDETNTEDEKEPSKEPEVEKPVSTPEPEKKPVQNSKPNQPAELPEEKPQVDNRSLADIMTAITTNIGETPALMTMELDSESFPAFTFADYIEGAEGFVCEPMMGSHAHSVVLVRLPEGADANAFADTVRANANPRKWICVEAEKVQVSVKGNIVLLVMSSAERTDLITSNFING